MKVTVYKKDTLTDYYFDPEHKAEVIGWYTKEYWAKSLDAFKAEMADGTIVALGALGEVRVA